MGRSYDAPAATVPPMDAPAGMVLAADHGLRRDDGGRLLIGGSPLRILRLSGRGAAVVDRWLAGGPVGPAGGERRLARRLLDAGMAHPVVRPAVGAVDVTVVVPVRDDPAGLDRCLASCGGAPIVVVDDGSGDGRAVREVVDRHGAQLVRRATSGGPGVARTEAMATVDTALVAFLDADVEAAPGWIEALAGHFEDPAVVAVAPRVRSRPGRSLRDRYEREHSPLDLGATPSPVGPRRRVAYVPTAAMVVRADVWRRYGGFDPALRFGEDVDLVWRLVAGGATVRYEPAVAVTHEPRRTWRAWLGQRRRYGASAAPLALRHGRAVAPARCSPWSVAVWGALADRRPSIAVGIAAATTVVLSRRLGEVPGPARTAVRLAVPGHLYAGLGLARAVTRAWWPLALPLVVASRRRRPVLLAAVAAPATLDWLRGARPADPMRSVALRIVDDVAYGFGVWEGMVRHRTLRPIAPDLTEWPGRRPAVETGRFRGS